MHDQNQTRMHAVTYVDHIVFKMPTVLEPERSPCITFLMPYQHQGAHEDVSGGEVHACSRLVDTAEAVEPARTSSIASRQRAVPSWGRGRCGVANLLHGESTVCVPCFSHLGFQHTLIARVCGGASKCTHGISYSLNTHNQMCVCVISAYPVHTHKNQLN